MFHDQGGRTQDMGFVHRYDLLHLVCGGESLKCESAWL